MLRQQQLLSQTYVTTMDDGECVAGKVVTCSVQAVRWVRLVGSTAKCVRALIRTHTPAVKR